MIIINEGKLDVASYQIQIYEKIQDSHYFGEDGALKFSLKGLENHKISNAKCLSEISRVQYALAMRHKADWKLSLWRRLDLLAYINYRSRLSEAEHYSDQWFGEIFGEYVSPEELLIRAEILYEKGKLIESKNSISQALIYNTRSPNTLSLLHSLLAKIYYLQRDEHGERSAQHHFNLSLGAVPHLEPHVVVRVRQSFSEYCFLTKDIRNALMQADMALEVAVFHNLNDLSIKLQPLLRNLSKYRKKV